MSRIYISPATGKQVSRQRFHQLQNAASGMCKQHKTRYADGPIKGLCAECSAKNRESRGVKRPHNPASVWGAVDFSRSNAEIAAELNVTVRAVEVQREKRGVGFSKRRLNAAAYDMLTALKKIMEYTEEMDDHEDWPPLKAEAEAAIAKATSKP